MKPYSLDGFDNYRGAVPCDKGILKLMSADQPDSGNTSLSSGAADLALRGHAPTLVISGPDVDSGDNQVLVSSPAGRSHSRVSPAGDLSVTVEGGDPGRPGETTVVHILVDKLQQLGVDCRIEAGLDDHGEDAILVAGEQRITIQVVTLVVDQGFWKESKRQSASRRMTARTAAGALRETIDKKGRVVGAAQAAAILLAIDARYAASLISESVLLEYSDLSPRQIADYGFASVWLVGPTTEQTRRLGGANNAV